MVRLCLQIYPRKYTDHVLTFLKGEVVWEIDEDSVVMNHGELNSVPIPNPNLSQRKDNFLPLILIALAGTCESDAKVFN